MKRSWLNFVACFVSVSFGTLFSAAMADNRGGGNHRSGGGAQSIMQSHSLGGGQFNSVRKATFNTPISNKVSPIINKPIGPIGPIGPIKTPGGPIVGPLKPPKGPIGPIGPIKPPGGGPIVGPVGPIGPIGPIKPPGGPIVGPIKPPVGPIGPIGPIKPSGGGGGGCVPGGNGKHCWPPIVLGCGPCGVGGYYGCYYPPVYTQTVVVAETPVVGLASAENLPLVPVGSTVTLQAKELGTTSGQVLLVIDKLTLGMQVSEWAGDHVTATVSMLGIAGPTKAELVVVKADGYAASSVKVELVPAKAATTGEAVLTVQAR